MLRDALVKHLLLRQDMMSKQIELYRKGYLGLKQLYESCNYQSERILDAIRDAASDEEEIT
jgi:hypothetical protein